MASNLLTEIRTAQEEYRAGHIDVAAARVERLRAEHPDHPDVLTALGVILVAGGDQEGAYASFVRALSFQPKALETLSWAAFVALNLRRFPEAEGHAQRLVELAPKNQRGHYLLANAFRAQEKIKEALVEIDRALELKPNDPDSLVTKARLLQRWQRPALAIDIYRQAMAIRPSPAAGVELAKMLLRDTRPQQAIEMLEQISPAMPKHARPYALFAEAFSQMRRFDEADDNWKLAKSFSPHPIAVDEGRAKAEIAAGRFEVAESILAELIARNQDLAGPFCILSTGKKMKPEDVPLIERAATIPRDSLTVDRQIELCYALGKCFDDVRDFERAIKNYDDANRLCLGAYKQRRAFDRDQVRAFTDYLIEQSGKALVNDRVQSGLTSDLPLFVVGMMRSGTTLTETILSAHSRVKGAGEQAFWTERAIDFIAPGTNGRLQLDQDLVLKYAQEYLQATDPNEPSIRYVIDKNPGNYELAAILHCAFPNSKIIHLNRHPVDNLLSIWMTPVSANVRFASDRSNLVFTYREQARLVHHLKEVLPADRFRSFRYEDLTSNPEPTIESMLDYLELEREEACFAPEKNERYVQTPSVYQVRQPIHRGSQGRWKNYVPWLGEFADLLEEA